MPNADISKTDGVEDDLVAQGALEAVVSATQRYPTLCGLVGCGTIANICIQCSPDDESGLKRKQYGVDIGGLAAAAECIELAPEDFSIQTAGLHVFEHMCSNGQCTESGKRERREKVVRAGSVEIAAKAVARFPQLKAHKFFQTIQVMITSTAPCCMLSML